jgi:hypothetical protein
MLVVDKKDRNARRGEGELVLPFDFLLIALSTLTGTGCYSRQSADNYNNNGTLRSASVKMGHFPARNVTVVIRWSQNPVAIVRDLSMGDMQCLDRA